MGFTMERYPTREEWLSARRSGVGGSDVAAILGLSPWRGTYAVWAEKCGLAEAEDISEKPRVEWGIRLEDSIFEKFAEEHPELSCTKNAGDVVFANAERPWAHATLDGWAEPKEGGEPCVVEVKTAHFPTSRDWEVGVPSYYLAQVQHYLSVTGWRCAYVVVLIDGWDYREFIVDRDDEDIAAVEAAVDAFWHVNVEGGERPLEVGAADIDAIRAAHPEGEGFIEGDGEFLDLIEEWDAAKQQVKRLSEREKKLRAIIEARLGDAKGAEFPEGTITWSRWDTTRIRAKELREEMPEVYERFSYTSPSSRLTWKEAR